MAYFRETLAEMCKKRTLYLLLSPALAIILFLSLYPTIFTIYISFFDKYLGRASSSFIGFRNYIIFLQDPRFWASLRFTVIYGSGVGLVCFTFGFGIALLLNYPMKGRAFFRAAFLAPWILSDVVVALIWKWMVDTNTGIFNATLESMGLPKQYWLMVPILSMFILIGATVWRSFAFQFVIFLASLQNIPVEVYEAAEIDGANAWQSFWRITIPMMKTILLIMFVLTMLGAMGSINIIIALTAGGPARQTETIGLYLYNNAFRYMRIGYASAVSIFFTLLNLSILGLSFFFIFRRKRTV